MTPRPLSKRFRQALEYATELHEDQARKGTDIPYVSHLIAVTALVLEYGGDEDQAIAALLHDAVEDCGGEPIRGEISERFGDRVAGMVEDCTDADIVPKPPWRERKQAYIAHVSEARQDSLVISMADKLHNATAILRDFRRIGPEVFTRFKPEPEDVAWYYRSLVIAFDARGLGDEARELLRELESAVGELERVVDSIG